MSEGKGCGVVAVAMIAILALVIGGGVGAAVVWLGVIQPMPADEGPSAEPAEVKPPTKAAGPGYAVVYPLEETLRIINGPLTPDDVKNVVLDRRYELRKCYQEGLTRDPNLKGEMSLQFTIAGSNGKVTSAVERHTKFADQKVAKCLLDQISSWKFPANKDDKTEVKFDVLMISISATDVEP